MPKKLHVLLISCCAIFLLFILSPLVTYNTSIDESFTNSVSMVHKLIRDPPSQSDKFVFIDVSRSKSLVELDDSSGNIPITDREQLAAFFSLLNSDTTIKAQAVVCDLLFDIPSSGDASLEAVIHQVRPLLIPFGEDEEGLLLPVFSSVETGYAGYIQSSGWKSSEKLVKYNLWPEKNKQTIPLRLKEMLDGESFNRSTGFIWNSNGIYYSNFIPGFLLTGESDYLPGGSSFYYLKELIGVLKSGNRELKRQFFDKRIIFIGDFENDVHATYSGFQSGTHILANVYDSFNRGDNRITWRWLLYVVLFSILIVLFFYYVEIREVKEGTSTAFKHQWKVWLFKLLKWMSIMAVLWIGCFVSYFLFSMFLSPTLVVLLITVYSVVGKQMKFITR
jgi:hypothetical protein